MDIGYELARLIAANFSYTIGTDMFVGTMPTGTDNGIFILRSGGTPHKYLPTNKTVMDVYFKDTSAQNAITSIEALKNWMHRMHTTETSEAYIYSILVLSDIEDMGRTLESEQLYKFTVEVCHRDLDLIS